MNFGTVTNLYYGLSVIVMLWMMWRYRGSSIMIFLNLVAFHGSLSYFIPSGSQMMRVFLTIFATYLFFSKNAYQRIGEKIVLALSFISFSAFFIADSLFLHQEGLLFTFSQYSFYLIPFECLFLFHYYYRLNPQIFTYLNKWFGEIIFIQILSSIYRFILLDFNSYEGMVGTFADLAGGGAGTSFPLTALLWVAINSNMNIKGWKSWLFILGILFIGIGTGKRAIVALYPTLFVLLALYVARKKYARGIMAAIVMAPLLFYLGLRLTPTLNPENEVWGSFDIDYALNYGEEYSMGETDSQGNREKGTGRVGASLLMWERIQDVEHYTEESWIGYGIKRIYSSADSFAHYYDRDYNFGVNHRGSMTGFVMMYLALGIIGFVLFMIYYTILLFTTAKYIRFNIAVYLLFFYDFILYNAQVVRDPFINILLIFTMFYANVQYTKKGQFVGQVHKYFQ